MSDGKNVAAEGLNETAYKPWSIAHLHADLRALARQPDMAGKTPLEVAVLLNEQRWAAKHQEARAGGKMTIDMPYHAALEDYIEHLRAGGLSLEEE
ncbi:hypothetical protein ANO11243_055480 [Dothideomycetidae sp. 11243]|nr:hypothetical protein ANO11243_055480 [fungal sp. No.11243]